MNTQSDFDGVYQNVLPELLAVPEDQLLHLNAEVGLAVTTVAMAIAHTRALASGPLAGVEGDLLDRLDRYRIALLVAHRRYHAAVNARWRTSDEKKDATGRKHRPTGVQTTRRNDRRPNEEKEGIP